MRRLLALLLIVPLTGCALVGTMPDLPPLGASACAEYRTEVQYIRDMEETYRTRGSWNRGAIYIAGGILLGALSFATAGAAAGIALGTIALTGIAAGGAGGMLAMVDNGNLAAVYVLGANELAATATLAEGKLVLDPDTGNRYTNQAGCAEALSMLRMGATTVRAAVEDARSDNAIAALIRAQSQRSRVDRASHSPFGFHNP